ncbi:MAG: RidA family protein [Pseudomonadota bacterium]
MPDRRLISTNSTFEAEMAYSRAVVQGDWCFVSGITGYDYEAMTLPDGIADQARNCFATLARVLDHAGFELVDLVRVQYTVTERSDIPKLAPIVQEALGDVKPAATLVVAGLMKPEMRFEVEATALRRSNNAGAPLP